MVRLLDSVVLLLSWQAYTDYTLGRALIHLVTIFMLLSRLGCLSVLNGQIMNGH